MGFGRGKGFTAEAVVKFVTYLVKGGGGKKTAIATETTPTYTVS